MRKLLTAVFVLFVASTFAFAQTDDAPRAELFGGYSYLRAGGGDDVDSIGMHGFNADFTGYLNDWFGITGAVSGNYKGDGVSFAGFEFGADTSVHTFTAGPRVRFKIEDSPITPFAHALFGVSRTSVSFDTNVDLPIDLDTDVSETNFTMIYGGGIDIKASDLFSIRAGQFDLVSTDAGNGAGWQNDFRYSGGIVIRF